MLIAYMNEKYIVKISADQPASNIRLPAPKGTAQDGRRLPTVPFPGSFNIHKFAMLRGMAATIRKIIATSKAPGAIGPYK